MVAVRNGQVQMIRWILQHALPDKKMILNTDYSGWNALHHAVMPYRLHRRFDIIDLLLAHGVPINQVRKIIIIVM